MDEKLTNPEQLKWMIFTHLTFVLSGIMLAVMDYISSKTKKK